MMMDIAIHCYNQATCLLTDEPVTLGVPLARGVLQPEGELILRDQFGQLLTLQSRPLTRWTDGSVKWLQCDFQADLPSRQESVFQLISAEEQGKGESPLRATPIKDGWQVDTGQACFIVDGKVLRPFLQVKVGGKELFAEAAEVLLLDAQGCAWTPRVDRIEIAEQGPVRLTLVLNGRFRSGRRTLLNFEARLQFYADSSRCLLEMRLHNPQAARHPGNLWDLGDPASVRLRQWNLRLPLQAEKKPRLRLQAEADGPWRELPVPGGGQLLQDSSGGNNWQSPVHRGADGQISTSFRGWRLTGEELLAEGMRAQPLACWEQVALSVDQFWQRFPKGLALNEQGVVVQLLPEDAGGLHELQGGEQITERVRFDFAAVESTTPWGDTLISVRCAPEVYRQAGVFTDGLWSAADDRYRSLLATALDDHKGFFAKREQLDEYGWRNFGELYADHEAAFHKEDRPFVSHYNNQYDPLASFYRQFLAGGDLRWGELAHDLAAHVTDIDINQTEDDREEYCHGLFWHTDHYLDAGLSTHRMASREHLSQKNPAFCGGGPDSEHCYTGGLTQHFLHGGDERFRQLVLRLADWCWLSIRGPQTLGAALLRTVKHLSLWRKSGGRATLWPRFPLNRGTGNCLNATLDAFELTGNNKYLKRATRLVRGTVHPKDRPEERDLLNAELGWSYTVFLASLGRYLQVKAEYNELDDDYAFGRESLLNYARWMAEQEYPYLDKPENLEFPNETWAGQDLRKSVVFFHAASHAEGEVRQRLLERSRFFIDAGLDHLVNSTTRHYARPLALVLQNSWHLGALAAEIPIFPKGHGVVTGRETPGLTLIEILRRSLSEFLTILPKTGLRREWAWFTARFGRG